MRNKNAVVSDPNTFVSDPGDRIHIIYTPVVSPNGDIELVASGKEDIQDKINSYREQTDMSFILQRMALGDTSVLASGEPMYGDFVNVPKSYAEFMQRFFDAKAAFDQLPLDIRNSFDNSFEKWLATSGNEEWFSKMKTYFNPVKDFLNDSEVSEEVKDG